MSWNYLPEKPFIFLFVLFDEENKNLFPWEDEMLDLCLHPKNSFRIRTIGTGVPYKAELYDLTSTCYEGEREQL